MNDLARSLPNTPRTPTWRKCLNKSWPLGAVGAALVALGLAAVLTLESSSSRRDLITGLAILPGIAVVMLWLRGVMRLRVLLTSGTATPAIIASRDAAAMRYAYHDESGQEHGGQASITTNSSLLHVVFDPSQPSMHVLARREDFVEDSRP